MTPLARRLLFLILGLLLLIVPTLYGYLRDNRYEQTYTPPQISENSTAATPAPTNTAFPVIQPVSKIAEVIHKHDGFLVVDAVQALGKLPLSVEETNADFLIFSSHKIGGPQGVGAIVLRDASLSPLPLLSGGGQENYHRGGTENVAAIAGFGAACEWHKQNLTKNIKIFTLRDSIEEGLETISREAGNEIAQPVFFGKAEWVEW